ncbi:MAG TPA: phasin family protein [Phycisphaerae bacterium]|nr:phasin family protein [Phycisphaerae bacterium]
MFETLDKMVLAGLGVLSMTRERAEKIFDAYVARGEAERDNRTGFVKELMDHAEQARKDLEKLVAAQVDAAVRKLSLATKEDIRRIEGKLDELLNRES